MIKQTLVEIVKGVATKRGLRMVGSRILGRTIGVVGWGVGAVSSVKMYRTFTKNDPHNERLAPLEIERQKWADAISCIGRDPYHVGDICSITEGGSINALGKKELFNLPNTRYGYSSVANMEYHAAPDDPGRPKDAKPLKEGEFDRFLDPSPYEAQRLIKRSIEYLETAEAYEGIDNLIADRDGLVARLTKIHDEIQVPYESGVDYSPIQQKLSDEVRIMVAMEYEFKDKIHDLEVARGKRRMKYAGIAAASFAVGAISPKKKT